MSANTQPTGMTQRSWKHLEPRPGSWRRQLFVKQRNMTVGQLVSTVFANGYTVEEASRNLDLPVEVIHESLDYYELNKALVQEEAAAERQFLNDAGYSLEPPALP